MGDELSRDQVQNWIANVAAPGPVAAMNTGAATRLGESWLRVEARAERAEAEVSRLRSALGEIASIGCGVPGHAVAVGCGANEVAALALSGENDG